MLALTEGAVPHLVALLRSCVHVWFLCWPAIYFLSLLRLLEASSKKVFAICTHGVLSGSAIERINNSPLEAIVVTNTILQTEKMKLSPKIKVYMLYNTIHTIKSA